MSYLRQITNKYMKCVLNNKNSLTQIISQSSLHLSAVQHKERDRRSLLKGLPKPDEGNKGERSPDMEYTGFERMCEFPTPETPNRLFDEIPFKDLPILHIKTTKNNTIFSLCRSDGNIVLTRSCGMDGFKNCRKGTNVAAQVTAMSMSAKIAKLGVKTVRLCIRGLGPGRMASIKGLQLGGTTIISITDTTPIAEVPPHRPPAARSV